MYKYELLGLIDMSEYVTATCNLLYVNGCRESAIAIRICNGNYYCFDQWMYFMSWTGLYK